MNRLKIILLSDSSKYVHLVIASVLFIYSETNYIALILLICELYYLSRKSKNLLIYSLVLGMIIFLRMDYDVHDYEQGQAVVVGVEENKIIVKDKQLVHLYLEEPTDYELGMLVVYRGSFMDFDQKHIPGGFDYNTYLRSTNVFAQVRVSEIEVKGSRFTLRVIPEKIKEYFENNFSGLSSTYLKLFILGSDEDMEMNVQNQTRKLGISHLFAISGMHLTLIIGIINYILNLFFLKKKTHQLIIGVFLAVYNIITGFSVSILRASLLAIALFFTGRRSFTQTDYLSFIMIGFLLFNPYILYNSGFQLSFLISFSIILGNSLIKTESKIFKVMKIGFLSTLVSLPIILKLNGSFGVMNIFYNVGFVYFVTLIFLPASFLSALFIDLEGVYLRVIELFEKLVDFAYKSNYYLSFQFSSEATVILYWLALLLLLMLYKTRYRKLVILSVLGIFVVNFINNVFPAFTYVRMLDVNQAESIHIHSGSCDILIDTGDVDEYDSVLNYFKKINVSEIDYLILTHQHQDHYGEALNLIEKLDVSNIIVSDYYEELSSYKQYSLLENEKINCGGIVIYNLNEDSQENENNNSLVLLTLIGNDKWLFTGDIEADKEQELISKYNFDLDVLKIAHHGSSTSTTFDFLENTKPEYGLISAGESGYDHPSEIVIKRLEQNNVKYFSTKTEGSITFYYPLNFHWAIIETKELDEKAKYQIKT